jgi:4-carboxymuconolactone decarboxylase
MHSRRELLKSTPALMAAALWGAGPALTEGKKMIDTKKPNAPPSLLTYNELRAVSPALEHYRKGPLLDGLWKRPELSRRDRSVVTVAALIARIQTIEMPFHFALALDNGVKPSELSEIITHLAFYSGWANAMSAVAITKDIFHQRGIGIDQLAPAKDKLLPLNEEAETQRATEVNKNFGQVSPGHSSHSTTHARSRAGSSLSGPRMATRSAAREPVAKRPTCRPKPAETRPPSLSTTQGRY